MDVQSSRYDQAMGLLQALSGPNGIQASLSKSATAEYRAVFARDAVMAGIAGLLAGDSVVVRGLVRTLERLRELQGAEGQIASNFDIRPHASPRVSFGTLAPRIDATTWYLVGIALGHRAGVLDAADFRSSVGSVVRLLDAIEYNGRNLLYIATGGNWADEYIYDGYILYDQVLRAWGLRLLGATYAEPAWVEKASRIGETIDARYWRDAQRATGHPVASLSPVGSQDMFDLAACSLLALSGVAPRLGNSALAWIDTTFLSSGTLPPAFHPVIGEQHPQWSALRHYHLHAFRNAPYEYHNGGIWPIWLGWLSLALGHTDHTAALGRLQALTAARIGEGHRFAFEEFLHGKSGVPGGNTQMAYSATGIIFMHHAGTPASKEFFHA